MTASFRDVELLSAYLDGQLDSNEAARLESRIKSDESLRAVLDDLREARGLLRQLPQRRAPRNFTLTLQMADIKPPTPRAYPVFRLATVLATLLFLTTFVANGVVGLSPAATRLAAAPAFGVGGGGAPNESAPATQAPAQPFAQSMATAETPSAANDNSRVMTRSTQTPELAPKAAAPVPFNAAPAQVQPEAPISFVWQIALAIVALIFGLTAWFVRSNNERKFRKQWNKKEN